MEIAIVIGCIIGYYVRKQYLAYVDGCRNNIVYSRIWCDLYKVGSVGIKQQWLANAIAQFSKANSDGEKAFCLDSAYVIQNNIRRVHGHDPNTQINGVDLEQYRERFLKRFQKSTDD